MAGPKTTEQTTGVALGQSGRFWSGSVTGKALGRAKTTPHKSVQKAVAKTASAVKDAGKGASATRAAKLK